MKLRLAAPALLVDLQALGELTGIRREGERFRIGALTTHATVAESAELQRDAPALWHAANQLGDPQVRNRGTIGGSCAHHDPAADYPAVLRAFEARFTIAGKNGTRELAADEFFGGMFECALESCDILTEIGFAAAPHSAYVKYHHPASHYALVGVAAVLSMRGDAIAMARIGVTGVGDSSFRAGAVERALVGVRPSDEAGVQAACAGAAAGVEARSELAASGAYRAAMTDVFAARAVKAAAHA